MRKSRIPLEAMDLWDAGHNLAAIAKIFNSHPSTIKNFLNKRGIRTDRGAHPIYCRCCSKQINQSKKLFSKYPYHYCNLSCYYKKVETTFQEQNTNGYEKARKKLKNYLNIPKNAYVVFIDGITLNQSLSNIQLFKDHESFKKGEKPLFPHLSTSY